VAPADLQEVIFGLTLPKLLLTRFLTRLSARLSETTRVVGTTTSFPRSIRVVGGYKCKRYPLLNVVREQDTS
jgi:hypothetical protein